MCAENCAWFCVMVWSEIKDSCCSCSGTCPKLTFRPWFASIYQADLAWRVWPCGYHHTSIWDILSLYYWINLWLESLILVIWDPTCRQMKQFTRSQEKGGLQSWGLKHNPCVLWGWPGPRGVPSPAIEGSLNCSLNASNTNSPKHSKWNFSHFD